MLKHVIFYRGSPPDSCKSLSLFIPMPSTHLWNAEYGRDFVNKYARLSRDLVCKISISPFFWSSWGVEQLGNNMLSHITLNITWFYLCNTCRIILKDNRRCFKCTNTTWLYYVVSFCEAIRIRVMLRIKQLFQNDWWK